MAPAVTHITPPDLSTLLTPILPALVPAAASSAPAPGILPFLAPILRQRVQILSSASQEPWLRLLCYDPARAPRLAETVAAAARLFEPHPVSGEVEVDWACDAAARFRRLDRETLQGLVVLAETGLTFRLVYCVDDPDGNPDGWRIAEVTVADTNAPFADFGGAAATAKSIPEAERLFHQTAKPAPTPAAPTQANNDDDDDDDGYWDRYDATPARTPANNRSPAPPPANGRTGLRYGQPTAPATDKDEDDYYAQYDDVQPAMDGHDPDEAAHAAQLDPPATGLAPLAAQPPPQEGGPVRSRTSSEERLLLQHPRPASSASSHGSHTVAKLEAAAAATTAGMQEQSEFGVRQHVSRSIRSLFQLSRSMGIGREEFEQMVKTELDVLGMMEE
ncbi:hypothetical protein A9K55_003288 [Cordyceps militaris]|uniref:Uncharacterized protein n=1 Tax=Cordyceps militaris TaxID=73501 RepID=A0A2H4S5H3_CORMI|nr:hypothetical protein A9K55_003288 [Cordyceps militaris]